jgi:hypothetical protein
MGADRARTANLIPLPVGLSLIGARRWDLGVIPGMDELSNPAVTAALDVAIGIAGRIRHTRQEDVRR